MSVQIIRKKGEPEWAVIPYAEYERLRDAAELAEDAELARRALRRDEERIPAEVVDRLIERENPVRVWREYRRLSRRQLAEGARITAAYLSQIETGRRGGSSKVLRAIANALDVDLDDIVRES